MASKSKGDGKGATPKAEPKATAGAHDAQPADPKAGGAPAAAPGAPGAVPGVGPVADAAAGGPAAAAAPPIAAGAGGGGAPVGPGGPPAPIAPPVTVPAMIGQLLPRTDLPLNPQQYTLLVTWTQFRRILRWHFVLLCLHVFGSPKTDQLVDLVGLQAVQHRVIATAVRFRHALTAHFLHLANRFSNSIYVQFPPGVKARLNQYNDIAIDGIGARIMAMLSAVYLNLSQCSFADVKELPGVAPAGDLERQLQRFLDEA